MILLHKAANYEQLENNKGFWFPVINGEKKSAIISCPGCGTQQGITGWEIALDGKVSPSVDHSAYCDFHDYIVLENWD